MARVELSTATLRVAVEAEVDIGGLAQWALYVARELSLPNGFVGDHAQDDPTVDIESEGDSDVLRVP